MGERTLEIKVISAEELKQVKWTGKMSPYVVAWIYPEHKVSTTACMEGGKNPKWDETLELKLEERYLHVPRIAISIEVLHNGTFGEVSLGTATIPITEVSKEWKDGSTSPQYLAYQLRRPSGRTQGVLNLSISLVPKAEGSGDHEASASAAPEVAVPPPAVASPVESSSVTAAAKPELGKETVAADGKTEEVEAKGGATVTREPALAPYPGAVPYGQGLPPAGLPQGYPAPVADPAGAGYPQGYPPAPQGYPAPQAGYASPQAGYAPPQAGYPPLQMGYPPTGYPQGYPPAGYAYPPPAAYPQGYPQPGQAYPQGGYPQQYQGYPPYAGPPAGPYVYPQQQPYPLQQQQQYAVQQPQKPKKSGGLGAGAGLGLGLGAGLLGGILLEEALDNDNDNDNYNDNDYDDGGDF